MRFRHQAEWEWGWKTPLLLRFPTSPPAPITRFLDTPLAEIALAEAETTLDTRLAALRSSRIGIRFERIQEALFRAHPDTESLRTGLVIPGRTEIDLLHRLRSLSSTVIHWEVAVKFYIGLDGGGSNDADRFIGPSLKDTLGIKTRAIFDRQLAVLRSPEVRSSFGAAFGIEEDDTVIALPKVHGVLYLPFRQMDEVRRPPEVAPDGLRGAWTSIDTLTEFIESVQGRRPAARVRWMSDRQDWLRCQSGIPANPGNEIDLKSFLKSDLESRIHSHFASSEEPIHAAILSTDEEGLEAEFRFFILRTGWLNAAERELETLRGESRIKI